MTQHFTIAATDAADLRRIGHSIGVLFSIAQDTHHTWAQRSAGDEKDGRGKAGTFVCMFCGQERATLSQAGRSCADEFEDK